MAARTTSTYLTGDTSDLQAALERVGVVAGDMSKKVRGSAADAGAGMADLTREAGESADKQAEAAGRAAAAWVEASASMSRAQKAAGDAAARAAKAVGASVDEQRDAYGRAISAQSDFEASQKRMAAAASAAADEQVAAAKKAAAAQIAAAKAAADAIEEQSARAREAQSKMAALGGKVLLGGSLVAGVGGYEAVKGATQLQQQMERLHTQAGVSQSSIAPLQKSVLGMAGQVGESPDQLAQGLYHVASSLNATLPPAQRMSDELKVLRTASEGAKIGGADLVDTTNALDAAVVSGIKGVQNYKQAMGAMNATVGAGDMTMQDLADSFGTGVVVQAHLAGISIQQLGGALAVLGDNNIRGAKAGTLMTSALRIMKSPSDAAAEALSHINLSSQSLAMAFRTGGIVGALQDLKTHLAEAGANINGTKQQMDEAGLVITRAFGGRQSAGVQDLVSQLDRLKGKTAEVGSGMNNMGSAWGATQKTLAQQVDELKDHIAALGDEFGAYLIPKLQAVVGATQSVITWMGRHKDAAEALAGVIGTVLGGAIAAYAYGKAVAFVNATKAMATGIGKLVGAVGSAASSIVEKFALVPAGAETAATETAASEDALAASAATTAGAVEASNTAAAASFADISAGAATEVGALTTAEGALLTEVETTNTAIEASNASVAASFAALLGPMAAVGVGAYALAKSGAGGPLGARTYQNDQSGGRGGALGPSGGDWNQYYNMLHPHHHAATYGPPTPGSSIGGSGNLGRGSSRSAAAGAAATRSGSYNPVSFAEAALAAMGITPTTANIRDFTAWEQQEGGNWHNSAKYNPLNTTMPEPGAGNTGSQGNIKVYRSWAQGLAATVKNIQEYSGIIAALREGVPVSQFSSVLQTATMNGTDSHWGTGAINTPGVTVNSKLSQSLKKYLSQTGGSTKTTAAATSTIPAAVATMLATAKALEGTKYTWGGGHSGWDPVDELKKIGLDCSGFVSRVLHAGGVTLPGPQTTEGLASNLKRGAGKYVTVYDRASGSEAHTFMEIMGKYFMEGGNSAANPKGNAEQITAKQAATELHGGGFVAYHPVFNASKMATDKQLRALGIGSTGTNVGSGNTLATYEQAIKKKIEDAYKAMIKGLSDRATSLLTSLTNDMQSGSVKSLESILGVSTGGQTSSQIEQILSHIGISPKKGAISHALSPVLEGVATPGDIAAGKRIVDAQRAAALARLGHEHLSKDQKAGDTIRIDKHYSELMKQHGLNATQSSSAGEQGFNKFISTLDATHNKALEKLATQLVAAHKQALVALSEELYAAQKTKDAESITLQATQLKDQTQKAADVAAAQLTVQKAQEQATQDATTAQTTDISNMTQKISDDWSAAAQAIQDHTQAITDQYSGQAGVISDQSQTQVDLLGERGLFGLNLIAQKLTVAYDQRKTSDDQQIALAQQNVDMVTQQQHAAEAAAQANLDQVTIQEQILASAAQQAADQVAIRQDQKIASATAHADSVQLAQDVAVQLAQTAVDLSATAPKAQQDKVTAQLALAQANATKAENTAQGQLSTITSAANAAMDTATALATEVGNQAQNAIATANQTLTTVTGQANAAIASAQQTLATVEGQAQVTEAALQGQASIASEEASVQFAGSGAMINIYGVPLENATAVSNEVSWGARTMLGISG